MTYSAQDITTALLRIKEDGFVLDNDAFGYAGAELAQGRMTNEGEEICWLYDPGKVGKGEVDSLAAARHSVLYGE